MFVIYLASFCCHSNSASSSCLSKGSSEWNPMKSNKYLHSHTFIYSEQMLFNDSEHVLHLNHSLSNLLIPSQRLVTMSVSLHT